MQKYTLIPHAKISNNKVLIYTEFYPRPIQKHIAENSLINLEDNRVKGYLSNGSKKLIKKRVQQWCDAIEAKKFVSRKSVEWLSYQITFCTLTLSAKQVHSDKEIKRNMLNRFLIELKREVNFNTYLWVAEKQKNANIHFHILFEKYIEWSLIRSKWNRIQLDNGYIDAYRNEQKKYHKNGFKVREDLLNVWKYENQLKAYQYGIATNWSNPNSTDIHSLRKVKNISRYITKYLTKGDENLLIDGALWSCSKNLINLKNVDFVIDSTLDEFLSTEESSNNTKIINADNCVIICDTSLVNLRNKSPSYYKQYMEIQNYNYQIIYNSK